MLPGKVWKRSGFQRNLWKEPVLFAPASWLPSQTNEQSSPQPHYSCQSENGKNKMEKKNNWNNLSATNSDLYVMQYQQKKTREHLYTSCWQTTMSMCTHRQLCGAQQLCLEVLNLLPCVRQLMLVLVHQAFQFSDTHYLNFNILLQVPSAVETLFHRSQFLPEKVDMKVFGLQLLLEVFHLCNK